ncbi:hypothetical protein Dda_7296 [Drechslerella dactyloides]|uniref:Uncharacterized protein n=1 Tax=Drechslerella dactyloides TaxID=74499 RepID=A0AAD6ISC7_DREDA|nr:hypothetical protein Dda_7296 [Drechslerella dactyloides]
MSFTNFLLFASLTVYTGAARPPVPPRLLPAVSPRAPPGTQNVHPRVVPDAPNAAAAAPGRTVTIEVPVAAHTPPSQAVIDARAAGVQSPSVLNIPWDTRCSAFIPFTNVGTGSGKWPDESGPRVYLDVDGVDVYRTPAGVIVDTGSTGFAIGKDTWISTFHKSWSDVDTAPANRAWKYLSSSDLLYTGYWVTVNITFKDLDWKPVIRAEVPVLVYDSKVTCTAANYPTDNGVCVGGGTAVPGNSLVGAYMGVGYGRRGDGMMECTPDVNPLFNVRGWWTVVAAGSTHIPTARCNYRNGNIPTYPSFEYIHVQHISRPMGMANDGGGILGYIVTKTGIIWGLTGSNTAPFLFHRLEQFSTLPMDWAMPPVCLAINTNTCRAGQLLPDTGVTTAYVSSPDIPAGNPAPAPPNGALSSITVDMPDGGHGMGRVVYGYVSGGVAGSVLPPRYEVRRTGSRVYMNVGSHFFNRFETAVDAEMGYYGINDLR